MSFHDTRFPVVIARGARGGPSYLTTVLETVRGREKRIGHWQAARGKWNVASGLKRAEDLATLIAFFRARQGRLYAFRFKDWSDYVLERQGIGTTGGAVATFQLYKSYVSGPTTITRNLTRPVSGTVRVWVNGTERTLGGGGTQFAVNLSTGIVTLGATLAATTGQAVEAACEFDVPARFDSDELALSLEHFDLGEWPEITLSEIAE